MVITPTNTGSAIAGASVGVFGWSLAGLYCEPRREAH